MKSAENAFKQYEGIWQSQGYNILLRIREGEIYIYEMTSISCLLIGKHPFSPSAESGEFEISPTGALIHKQPIFQLEKTLKPLEKIPLVCNPDQVAKKLDPVFNFEVFWYTFQENFAHFNRHHLDWAQRYDKYRPLISSQTSDDELFSIFQQILTGIDDRHTGINRGDGHSFTPAKRIPWVKPADRKRWLMKFRELFTQNQPLLGDYDYWMVGKSLEKIQEIYLQNHFKELCNRVIFYGEISEDIGYVCFIRFSYFLGNIEEEFQALDHAMDIILSDFATKKSIIVDVRFNPGSFDVSGLQVVNRFSDTRRIAFEKKVFYNGKFTPKQSFYTAPKGKSQYTNPIYLLTSNFSASGAETFTMAMKSLPYVTIVGEPTQGSFSDQMVRNLPNGWRFSLSPEVYTDYKNKCYEGQGYPPDIVVPFDFQKILQGQDTILDTAIEHWSQRFLDHS